MATAGRLLVQRDRPRRRTFDGISLALPVALAVLSLAAPARATPNFPAAIQKHLDAPAPPPCSICHAGGVTGRGTVTTLFGTAMRARGLVPYDEATLIGALDALAQEGHDTDRDGVTDTAEITAGTDPSAAGDGGVFTSVDRVPEYGCSIATGPSQGGIDAFDGGLLVAWAWALRRRRRSALR